MKTLTNEIVSEERLCELFASFADDKHIQEQFGDGDYANESGDIMSIIAELKSSRAQLAELRGQDPADFRWRHRADEHSGASAWTYLPCDRADDFIKRIADKDNAVEYGYFFSRPVPPATDQPIIVTDDMAMAFHRATTDGDVGSDDVSDIKIGLKAALCNISTAQPYTLPDEWTYNDAVQFVLINGMSNETRAGIAMHVFNHCRAAMLQSGNSPVWSGVDKVNSPVIPDGSVPEGYALVPGTIYLDESDIESICSQCGDGGGNYGDFTRGILWVGDIQDDEGNITHGLHISSDDYPEEGGITLAKFSAAPQHKAG
ncbi:hypothetical protein WCT81_04590 [Pectobacterium versatile]|uniref:hypothetical protein n=1 Tax=Pectobacterium versatile TaxID=2488639 RepID=UPI00301722EA